MPSTKSVAKADADTVNANKGTLFELNDDELDSLKSTRGRKATPSVYLAEVREAVERGDETPVGIRLSATVKSPWVQAQIRKAAKELGVEKRVVVYNREEKGFVAFKVKNELD